MRIAVYGASGYTGKLVAAEVARRGFDVVLAGRSDDRLRAAATEIGLPDAETRTAGVDDMRSLRLAFTGCDAVINCAGPFTFLGEPVVRAAIDARCQYVDTTGEQLYMKRIFERCGTDARNADVAVVPAMGYDIVPGNLIAHLTATTVEPVSRLRIGYTTTGFDMTRGTMHSILEMFKGGDLRFEAGSWTSAGVLRRTSPMRFPGRTRPSPTLRFPGGEVVTVPRHIKTEHVEVVMDAGAMVPGRLAPALLPTFGPVLSMVLRTRLRHTFDKLIDRLPEGPDPTRRGASTFTIVAEATGTDGQRARGEIHGRDIYGCTAVLTVEGVRRLCETKGPKGVLAPSQAFELPSFLDFLRDNNFSWSVEQLP